KEWSGRLVLRWPPPERSWWRWADRNAMPIDTIHAESVLAERLPEWNALVLTWLGLQDLPPSWEAALSHWRGIYTILDRSCGKLYVGSAYGEENLLSRWRGYSKSGHGGNVELKGRDPKQFQFSILQRVSPDMPAEEVIRVEASWKDRLGTREFGLNKN
ncbi:MAG: GIY-YIG nuclease family protein, partial [Vicinamibacterales bacterium]